MEFVKRNKLIFIIGGSVCFILIALIILARRSVENVERTALTPFAVEPAEDAQPINTDDFPNIPEGPIRDIVERAVNSTNGEEASNEAGEETELIQPLVETTEPEKEITTDNERPTAGIAFIENYGFYPKMPSIKSGQKVLIINKSSESIILRERTKGVNPQINGVTIAPDGIYRTRLYGKGFWTMEDEVSGKPILFTIN